MSNRRSDAIPVSWSRISVNDVTLTLIAVFSAALYVNSTFQVVSASVTSFEESTVTEPTTLTDHQESSSGVTPNEVSSIPNSVSDMHSSSSTDMTTNVMLTSGSVLDSTSALFTTVQSSSTTADSKNLSLILTTADSILPTTSHDDTDTTSPKPIVKTSGSYSETVPQSSLSSVKPENWSTASMLRDYMMLNETKAMKAATAMLSTSGSPSVTSSLNYVTSFTASLNSTSDQLSDSNMVYQQPQGTSLQLALGVGLGVGCALLLIFLIVLTVCIVNYDRKRSCKRTTHNDAESSYIMSPSSSISQRSTGKHGVDVSKTADNMKMSERSGDDVIRYAEENETTPTKATSRVKIRPQHQQRTSIVELASGKELPDDKNSNLNGSPSSSTAPTVNSTHRGDESANESRAHDKRRDKGKRRKQSKIRRHQRNSISQLAREFSDDAVAGENSLPTVAAAASTTAETVTSTTHGPNTSTDNVSTTSPSVYRNISVDHTPHSMV